jgi:hypothetical protein
VYLEDIYIQIALKETCYKIIESSVPGSGSEGIFLFATVSNPEVGPIGPPIQQVLGVLIPELKRPGREDDYSPPYNVKVKNVRSYTSIHQFEYVFME